MLASIPFTEEIPLTTNYSSSGKNLKLKEYYDNYYVTSFALIGHYTFTSGSTSFDIYGGNFEGWLDLSEGTNISSLEMCMTMPKITNVILPQNITMLKECIFAGDTKLSQVAFYNPDPTWMEYTSDTSGEQTGGIDSNWFKGMHSESMDLDDAPIKTIYVPDDKVTAYNTYATVTSTSCKEWFDPSTMQFKGLSEMGNPPSFDSKGLSDMAILGIALGCGLGVPLLVSVIVNCVTLHKLKNPSGQKKTKKK